MTDLTPEQIAKWAEDATAKRHYTRQLKATLERVNLDTLLDDTDLARLHAHALHLQQQARIDELERVAQAATEFVAYMPHLEENKHSMAEYCRREIELKRAVKALQTGEGE